MFSETNIIDEDSGIYAGKLVMSVYPPPLINYLNINVLQQPCAGVL